MATIINGDGIVTVEGTSTTQGRVRLNEDTDNGTNYVELQAPASVPSTVTFTLPSADGTNGQIIQTNGSGVLSFANAASLATPLTVTGNSTAGAEIRLPEDTDNGSNYVALKAADNLASNVTFTLPSADGTSGQVLQTNASGTLSFANLAVANGGTGQTSLTANNIILGNGTSAVQFVAPGTSGNVLTSNGTTWTSGTTSVAGGGTGQTSLTANNVILGNGTSAVQFVAPGTNGNVLTSNGTSWVSQAISAGGLTLIGSLTLGNSAQSISLPAGWSTTYKYLLLIYQGVYVSASGTASVYIRFNSDTGNKYSYSWIAFGLGTAQGSQSVMSGPSIGNNDSTSAFLQLQYFPSESSFYRMRVMGSVSINSRVYAYGGAYETTSAPSTFDWSQFAGPGYYLNGALTLYGAS